MPVVVPPTRRSLRDALHAEFVEKSKTFIPGYVVTPEGLRSPQEYEAMQVGGWVRVCTWQCVGSELVPDPML
jgi:hypothetical protein